MKLEILTNGKIFRGTRDHATGAHSRWNGSIDVWRLNNIPRYYPCSNHARASDANPLKNVIQATHAAIQFADRHGLTSLTLNVAIQALSNTEEEDVGTGGPDLLRRIFPLVKLVDGQGVRDVEDTQLATICEELLSKEREL